MSRRRVVVFDYGSGNVHSAVKAVEAAGADVRLTDSRREAREADGLIVPGVGAFAAVIDQLRASGADEVIDRRLAGGRPVFGICVGMQVMFESGTEGSRSVAGLGEWPGVVDRLTAPVLPHMGWNTVDAPESSRLFAGVSEERFYFVHSYAARSWSLDSSGPFTAPEVTWATHGDRFIAAVENGPLWATQFHPEKSGVPGVRLLSNWVDSFSDH